MMRPNAQLHTHPQPPLLLFCHSADAIAIEFRFLKMGMLLVVQVRLT